MSYRRRGSVVIKPMAKGVGSFMAPSQKQATKAQSRSSHTSRDRFRLFLFNRVSNCVSYCFPLFLLCFAYVSLFFPCFFQRFSWPKSRKGRWEGLQCSAPRSRSHPTSRARRLRSLSGHEKVAH